MTDPVLLVVAGPNGAGKTTVTVRLRQERWSVDTIAFETVFSTDEKVDFLRRAKSARYFVRVFFVGTSDPRINASRVAGRVMQGGHAVPIDKIVNRYTRSIANLAAAIRIADRVYIYDNSIEDVEARLVARTMAGRLRKVYGDHPDWVARTIGTLPHHDDFVDARVA